MNLKPGDFVYLVADSMRTNDPEVYKAKIAQASDKQIKLAGHATRFSHIVYAPSALGQKFFATPEEAITAYRKRREADIVHARRLIEHSIRDVAWCDQQLHPPVAPPPPPPPPPIAWSEPAHTRCPVCGQASHSHDCR